MRSAQESFWAGEFGNKYVERNGLTPIRISKNLGLFCKIVERMEERPKSILEFGCNIGTNLVALNLLFPDADKIDGVEINATAAQEAQENIGSRGTIYNCSILESDLSGYDYVFTCGVLIHIAPESLQQVYKKIYDASSRYISFTEYYNPTPVEVNYRGHSERLFKRDFMGEFQSAYPDVSLVNYGFFYHNDKIFGLDDDNWFLVRK